ncbi:MAG: ribosomal protein L7/L12 [Deltaproteobacteria bacterium]|nr:ribosomal protein L7/L12 [Deltaproteobacteria bacterium]
MSDDLERQLLAAIQQSPDDEDARAVYADWLEDRGDVRGEYLRLEAQLHRIPARLTALSQLINASWIEAIARLYDVVLGNPGTSKIMVIKLVREVTGFGLKEAKDVVDVVSTARPYIVQRRLEREAAAALAARFTEAGATIAVVPHFAKPTMNG